MYALLNNLLSMMLMFACTVKSFFLFLLFIQRASVLQDRVDIFPGFSSELKEPGTDCVMI